MHMRGASLRSFFVGVLAVGVLVASGANATDPSLALNLGSVLAAEDYCGLSSDQGAIEAFIEKNVSASDMGFASDLQSMTSGQEYFQQQMSPSEKTAHCAQIRRVAKSFGFTK